MKASYLIVLSSLLGIALAVFATPNGGGIDTTEPYSVPIPDATFTGPVTASNLTGTCHGDNTGDQTITLSGAVTGTGTGAITTSISALRLPLVDSLPTCNAGTEGTLKFYENAGGKKTLCVCGFEGLISNAYGWFSTTANGNCA